MGKIIFLYDRNSMEAVFGECKGYLEERGHQVLLWKYNDSTIDNIFREQDYDLLVVPNLLGYDVHTLTNGVSLNLITGKVYSLITEKKCQNESFLRELISIAHFFYFVDEDKLKSVQERYPHVPNLTYLEEWGKNEKTKGAVLADSICGLLKRCYID